MIIKIRDNWKAYFYAPIGVAREIWNVIDKKKMWLFIEWCVVMFWISGAFLGFILFSWLLWEHHWFLAAGWFWFGMGFFWATIPKIGRM